MNGNTGVRIINSVRTSGTRSVFPYTFGDDGINFDEVTPTRPARQSKIKFLGGRTSAPVYTVRPIMSVRASETRAVFPYPMWPINFDEVTPTRPARQSKVTLLTRLDTHVPVGNPWGPAFSIAFG